MHSVALSEVGEIWQWGEPWGEFEMTVHREPRRLELREAVVRVACGSFHNLALTASGSVYSWGINDYGQLGDGSTSNAKDPVLVEGLGDVVITDVACGGWHSVAISDAGEVYVWGRGEYGRLGLGEKGGASKLTPRRVEGLEGHRVVEASCGGTHTLVVTAEGRMFIWGRGSFGRLGTGNEQNHFAPVEVCLPGGPERWWIIAAAAGGRHSMCLAIPDNGDLGDRLDVWDRRSSDFMSTSADVSRGPSRSATPMGSAVKAPASASAPAHMSMPMSMSMPASQQWSGASQDASEEKHKVDEDADDEEEDESQVSELDGDSEEELAGSQRAPSYLNMVKSLQLEEMKEDEDGL